MKDPKCIFCQADEMKKKIPCSNGSSIPCDRLIYENKFCFAVLSPEQYTKGDTLVIFSEHIPDLTYSDISEQELCGFSLGVRQVATLLKEKLKNEKDMNPERIYVCILCDGVRHLHAHLIPRYPFTRDDEIIYKHEFLNRDGAERVHDNICKHRLGGFWYVAERERNHKGSVFGRKNDQEKAKCLERLAEQLRAGK